MSYSGAVSTYRPDIDGLRAIAILSVIVNHAFPSALPGGFVGVDIFFVISGYLISRHIMEELATGSFRLRNFYARRVRRIFPALILVMLSSLLAGWVMLTPEEYEKLGRHVFAGSLFLSNILSWREAGYFDSAAATKPMLHLWSLGIEEQFYIVWPLALALVWRLRQALLPWRVAGLMALSLVWSLYTVSHDVVADFYSLFTRFWELALGAVVAWLALHRPEMGLTQRQRLPWVGLMMILAASVLVPRDGWFPGAWALLPTVGAGLLIHAGLDATVNQRLLALRPMVWVGLISYPLYLWHWPLLTFARILQAHVPSTVVVLGLVLMSFVLAWLTWRFVEKPIRSAPRSRALIWALCLTMAAVGVTGYIVKSAHGYRWRLEGLLNGDSATMVIGADRDRLLVGCGIEDAKRRHGLTYCLHNSAVPARYAMLGDSKGEALFYGLVREAGPAMSWVFIGTVYPPQQGEGMDPLAQQRYRIAFETVLTNPSVEVVVFTMALRGAFSVDPETGFIATGTRVSADRLQAYSKAIAQFEHAGKRVLMVLDHPTFPDPPSCVSGGLTRSAWLNQMLWRQENPRCQLRYSDHLAGTQPYRDFVSELKRRHPTLAVYDPSPVLCDTQADRCSMTRQGQFLYSYGDHLSDTANSMIAQDLLPLVRQLSR